MSNIFIEAESFKHKGGWVVDSASMEIIHSAYLMAHGIGVPVADAYTDFEICDEGNYYIWSLTRDWTATWEVEDSAGKYTIKIDGIELENTLGTNSKEWAWQLAGKTMMKKGKHTIALHDLTGFNGRCDCIYITKSAEIPSNDIEKIDEIRKEFNWKEATEKPLVYDLVVVGGGIAGICTALAAKRKGLNVALINDRPVLGGCNSSEVRVCMGGQINLAPYDKIGDVVKEIAPIKGHPTIYKEEYFEDMRKLFAFEISSGENLCDVLLNESVFEIEQVEDKITAVISTNTISGKKTKIRGKLFSDCSGDGILARLAGAEVMYGTESKSEFGEQLAPDEHKDLVMGQSIRWYSEKQEEECAFPDINWNLNFDEDSYLNCYSGDWEQETGFTRNMAFETEYIRDYGLRAIYSNWSYQKNHCKNKENFAKSKIMWVSPFGGKREGFRVKGDYILTQHDMEDGIEHSDATAKITWGIDIHYPEPVNQKEFGEAFRSFAYHRSIPYACPVPYRCLYSKDVSNLFLGGRIVSMSHIAFSAVRVMRTLGMLGEVVGLAAYVCKAHSCFPRDVYKEYLKDLKQEMKAGVTIPVAFACNGVGGRESYHFKDLGWWNLSNETRTDDNGKPIDLTKKDLEKFNYCINSLKLETKNPLPEEWKSKE